MPTLFSLINIILVLIYPQCVTIHAVANLVVIILRHGAMLTISWYLLRTPRRSSSHPNQIPTYLLTMLPNNTFLKQTNDECPDQPKAVWILVSSVENQLNLILSLIGLPSADGGGDPAGAEPAAIDAT